MNRSAYMQIAALAREPEAVGRSVAYVKENMARFLKKKEKVLICFRKEESSIAAILEQAIVQCECTPLWLGEDRRWMTILKLAFTSKCNCIIGSPLMLLGLSKLAKHLGTPLFARNVLLCGYPSAQWLMKGVETGLDCKSWGFFDPGIGAVIGGFSCGYGTGVHLRGEEYGVDIVDQQGRVLPSGEPGTVVLYPVEDPSVRFFTLERGRLETSACGCGSHAPRLLDLDTDNGDYENISKITDELHQWSSILDCQIDKTEYGLVLELVVFKGEKLPKLPSAAKLTVRSFDPDTDEPFAHHERLKNRYFSADAH